MYGSHTQDEFAAKLATFVEGCQNIYKAYRVRCDYIGADDPWSTEWLQKRVRVVHSGVHCFVDMQTGDVLKAAGWKAPAKHARGNIYDEHNGLGSMGPHGPAYLK